MKTVALILRYARAALPLYVTAALLAALLFIIGTGIFFGPPSVLWAFLAGLVLGFGARYSFSKISFKSLRQAFNISSN